MIKMVLCVHRRRGLSRAEFAAYWRERHAPLVRDFAEALGVRRYVQSLTLDSPWNELARELRGSAPAHDGIAELWWDHEADLAAAAESPEARRAHQMLVEDEARFVDLERSTVFLTEEREVFGPGRAD